MARVTPWYLRPTPWFMRQWPFFRRYFWQPEEVARIRSEARRLWEDLVQPEAHCYPSGHILVYGVDDRRHLSAKQARRLATQLVEAADQSDNTDP